MQNNRSVNTVALTEFQSFYFFISKLFLLIFNMVSHENTPFGCRLLLITTFGLSNEREWSSSYYFAALELNWNLELYYMSKKRTDAAWNLNEEDNLLSLCQLSVIFYCQLLTSIEFYGR